MVSKQRPKQVELAIKAAKLKAKQQPPRLTRKDIEERNRRARLAADHFIEEQEQHEQHEQEKALRLLSKRQVLDRVCVTFPTLWKWMRAGTFPRARVIGGKSVWLEREVNAWIEALPLRRLKGDPEGEAA